MFTKYQGMPGLSNFAWHAHPRQGYLFGTGLPEIRVSLPWDWEGTNVVAVAEVVTV